MSEQISEVPHDLEPGIREAVTRDEAQITEVHRHNEPSDRDYIVIALVLVVQQLEGNVLQPILVGRTMDLHPALVIVAVTAGGTLAGITGAFLAVPVIAVGAVVVRYARQQLAVVEPGPGSPPAAAGQPNEEVVQH